MVHFEGKSVAYKHKPAVLRVVVVIVPEIIPLSFTNSVPEHCLEELRGWIDWNTKGAMLISNDHNGVLRRVNCQEPAITGRGDIAGQRKKCILLVRGLSKGDSRSDYISKFYPTCYWAAGLESCIWKAASSYVCKKTLLQTIKPLTGKVSPLYNILDNL